jgi:hypothetical protein
VKVSNPTRQPLAFIYESAEPIARGFKCRYPIPYGDSVEHMSRLTAITQLLDIKRLVFQAFSLAIELETRLNFG